LTAIRVSAGEKGKVGRPALPSTAADESPDQLQPRCDAPADTRIAVKAAEGAVTLAVHALTSMPPVDKGGHQTPPA
jgi:hypothetical protein